MLSSLEKNGSFSAVVGVKLFDMGLSGTTVASITCVTH
jgi:hypothetical protein